MFPRPEIAGALGKFVLVELYTDGTDAAFASQPAIGAKQVSNHRHSVLRDSGPGWERGRHVSRRYQGRGRLPGVSAEKRSCGGKRT